MHLTTSKFSPSFFHFVAKKAEGKHLLTYMICVVKRQEKGNKKP